MKRPLSPAGAVASTAELFEAGRLEPLPSDSEGPDLGQEDLQRHAGVAMGNGDGMAKVACRAEGLGRGMTGSARLEAERITPNTAPGCPHVSSPCVVSPEAERNTMDKADEWGEVQHASSPYYSWCNTMRWGWQAQQDRAVMAGAGQGRDSRH